MGVSTSTKARSTKKARIDSMMRALLQEDLAHLLVDHEVHVSLAVALFHVLEAVPLLGQGAERFREELHALRRGWSAPPSSS